MLKAALSSLAISLLAFSLIAAEPVMGRQIGSHDRSEPKQEQKKESQQDLPELSKVSLERTVREAKIFSSEYPVHALVRTPETEVFTVRHPKATDQDCKIDAVLLAKLLFDKFPKLVRLKLVLHDDKSASSQSILVTTGDVRAYGNGSISQDELLNSLELSHLQDSDNAEPSSEKLEGPFARARQLLVGRIANLKENGTDTKPFDLLLSNINSEADSLGTAKVGADAMEHLKLEINDLNRHLSDQEEMIREAKNISHGYGQNRAGKLRSSFNTGGKFQLFRAVKSAVEQKQSQGINVTAYQAKLDQIRQLRLSGKFEQAEQEMQALARSLGIEH